MVDKFLNILFCKRTMHKRAAETNVYRDGFSEAFNVHSSKTCARIKKIHYEIFILQIKLNHSIERLIKWPETPQLRVFVISRRKPCFEISTIPNHVILLQTKNVSYAFSKNEIQ